VAPESPDWEVHIGWVSSARLNKEGDMPRTFAATIITEVEFVGGDTESEEINQNYLKHLTTELEKAASNLSLRTIKDARVTMSAGAMMRPPG
jgi:hypothetical protein